MNFLKKIEKAFTDCILSCFMALNPQSVHKVNKRDTRDKRVNKRDKLDRVIKGEYRKIDVYSSDDDNKPILNPCMKKSDDKSIKNSEDELFNEIFDEFDMVLP